MFVWTLTRSTVSCSHYALTLYCPGFIRQLCAFLFLCVALFYFAHLFIVRDVCLEDDFALLQYILWFNVVVRQTLMCYCRWFHHIVGNLPILSRIHRNIHMCNICGECVLCRKPKEKKTFHPIKIMVFLWTVATSCDCQMKSDDCILDATNLLIRKLVFFLGKFNLILREIKQNKINAEIPWSDARVIILFHSYESLPCAWTWYTFFLQYNLWIHLD